MSVSNSTGNKTTSLERAYRGRSRRCHHPFHLPDYRVVATTDTAGRWQPIVEIKQPRGCPSCGVISSRRKERRLQQLRDIPVAGPVEVLWSKYRWYCKVTGCERLSFFESTPQVPRRARSTGRLRDHLVDGASGTE